MYIINQIMDNSIKDYIKENSKKQYSIEDVDKAAKKIAASSEGRYSKKKARRILCYYASIENGSITFNVKNKNKKTTYEFLSESFNCEENDGDSCSDSDSDDGQKESKPKQLGMLRFGFMNKASTIIDSDEEEEKNKKNKKTTEELTKSYDYPKEGKINVISRKEVQFGPYSTQSFHDKQKDDKITSTVKKARKTFDFLNSIKYPEQRSDEWFANRKEKITASDGGCVVGLNSHEPQWKFVLKKVIEQPFQSNIFCYHGKKLEEIATMVYEYRMNVKVKEFGMVPHKTIKFLGASPDGIVSPYKLDGKHLTEEVGTMLEIKCPFSRKIKKTGDVKGVQCPIYYWVQVQLQLECCDLEKCDFWQCEIWEYDDREDFIEDTNPDQPFLSLSTDMEKGVLIQLLPHKYPDESKDLGYNDKVYSFATFIYPPKIEMTPYDVDIWVAETCSKLKETHPGHHLDKVVYWKMVNTHNVAIYRDRDWFNEHLPIYEKVWGYVTYFRENLDKANVVFDHIESMSLKSNSKIMEIFETVTNEPTENDSDKKHKQYAKYIAQLMKDTEENEKKKKKKEKEKKAKKTSTSDSDSSD